MMFFVDFRGMMIKRIIIMSEYAYTDLMNGPMKPSFPLEIQQFSVGYLIGYLQCLSEQDDNEEET